jgi:hypothetical protein
MQKNNSEKKDLSRRERKKPKVADRGLIPKSIAGNGRNSKKWMKQKKVSLKVRVLIWSADPILKIRDI